MSEPVVQCEGVGHVYPDGTRANTAIDLDIRPGELVTLVGPNGAGKTTLVRQIATELRPTEGVVRVLGRDAHADPEATRARLGIIPQHVGLFDGLRVDEHVRLLAPLKRISRGEVADEVERVLRACDLDELRERRVGALSGGQQRRVLVALALLGRPALLLLDEPTVGLDPVTRRACWEMLRSQRDAGVSILLTTHYLDEAEGLSDRIGVIEGGRLTRLSTLEQLRRDVGDSHRVSEHDPDTGAVRSQHYFDSLAEAQRFAADRKLDHYSVSRVSLEDVYLRLVGHGIDRDGGAT